MVLLATSGSGALLLQYFARVFSPRINLLTVGFIRGFFLILQPGLQLHGRRRWRCYRRGSQGKPNCNGDQARSKLHMLVSVIQISRQFQIDPPCRANTTASLTASFLFAALFCSLDENYLRADGGKAVAEALATNKTLKSIK